MIESLHHVQITIPPGSEAEARAFYCGLLEMREIPKPDELSGRGGFWLEAGDRQVHVGVEDGIDRCRSKAHLAYLVNDLEYVRTVLVENRFDIIEGSPIPGYSRFEIRDPFGNRVEFLQAV